MQAGRHGSSARRIRWATVLSSKESKEGANTASFCFFEKKDGDEEKKKKVFLVLNFCHFAGIIAKGTHLSNVNFLKLLSNILIKQS